jgi:glycosyltransferase involved in cell wall biosynthesis
MSPKVSVLIATYNRAALLRDAIESVLQQTYSDYEIVIVDDGSNDATADVIAPYLLETHPSHGKILYFQQKNQGKSVALNNAFAMARGEWIAILDSDDVWLPEKLEWQFRAFERFPECSICFTDCRFSNNPRMDMTAFQFFGRAFGEMFGKVDNPTEFLLDTPCALIITLLFRASLVRESGGFDPLLRFTEDYDFTFRLALASGMCYVNLPLAVADRSNNRHRGASLIWDDVKFRLQCEQYRYEKWLQNDQVTGRIRWRIVERLRSVHSGWANLYLSTRDYPAAKHSIERALKYQRGLNLLLKWLLTAVCPVLMRQIALRRGFEVAHF